jgi:S1-C subfamily serine protease
MPASYTVPRYNQGVTITKSDTVNIYSDNSLTDAVQFGGAGVAVVVWQDDSLSTMTVVAGELLPLACKRINSTNTTATLMIGLKAI